MKDLKECIHMKLYEGGFFKNIGSDFGKIKEWFDQVPVVFEQYLTKWNTKEIKKDRNSFTITFLNDYKKNNKEKEVILDLSPYIQELSKVDPRHCIIKFSTGLYTNTGGVDIKINNKDKKAKDDANDNFYGWDKKIRIAIIETKGENPHPEKQILDGRDVNKMISFSRNTYMSYASRHQSAWKGNANMLLELMQYTDDYPFVRDGWTVLHNNLEK